MPDLPMTEMSLTQMIATLLVPGVFALLWVLEARRPAKAYPPDAKWRWLGLAFFAATATVGSLVPLLMAASGLASRRLLDLSDSGAWGVLAGLLATSFVHYFWHRAEHRFNLLWRLGHQLHHSARRVDIPGAFFVHPTEVVIKTALGVGVNTVLLGLAPGASALVTSLLAAISIFQHWNTTTPHWLGWIIARPEMHGLHHALGVHAHNYSDLSLWDIVFCTHVNPVHFDAEVGFDADAAGQIGAMLRMRDVNAPPAVGGAAAAAHQALSGGRQVR